MSHAINAIIAINGNGRWLRHLGSALDLKRGIAKHFTVIDAFNFYNHFSESILLTHAHTQTDTYLFICACMRFTLQKHLQPYIR